MPRGGAHAAIVKPAVRSYPHSSLTLRHRATSCRDPSDAIGGVVAGYVWEDCSVPHLSHAILFCLTDQTDRQTPPSPFLPSAAGRSDNARRAAALSGAARRQLVDAYLRQDVPSLSHVYSLVLATPPVKSPPWDDRMQRNSPSQRPFNLHEANALARRRVATTLYSGSESSPTEQPDRSRLSSYGPPSFVRVVLGESRCRLWAG